MAKVVANYEEFNAKVGAFVAANPGRIADIQRKLMFDAFAKLVEYTPVDTGYLRNNWQATVGRPADGTVGTPVADDQTVPRPDASRVANAVAVIPPYQKTWLTNNVDYVERINDGWASYEGAQMLERTVNDLVVGMFGG
jgi:hypothetical protein